MSRAGPWYITLANACPQYNSTETARSSLCIKSDGQTLQPFFGILPSDDVRLVLGLDFLIHRVGGDLLVITLEGSQVLTGLGEFTFLHTLTNVPVDEGTLGVHEVELVVESRPGLGDGRGVGQHAAIVAVSSLTIFMLHLFGEKKKTGRKLTQHGRAWPGHHREPAEEAGSKYRS